MTQNPTALELAQGRQIAKLRAQIIIAIAALSQANHDGSDPDCRICKAAVGLEEVLNDQSRG